MNFNFQIKNFGQIEDVKVPVRPFTVIAGPNASGKSFFTKSLYSFLKIAKQDHLPQDFSRSLEKTSIQLALLSELLNLEEDEKLSSITKKEIDFRDISKKIEEAKRDLIANKKSDNKSQEPYRVKDMQALTILVSDAVKKLKSDLTLLANNEKLTININRAFSKEFVQTLLNNFQEEELEDLVKDKNANQNIEFQIENYGTIEYALDSGEVSSNFTSEGLNNLKEIKQVVYLESPVYWKLKQPLQRLKIADSETADELLPVSKKHDVLSGVPEHFYDLINLIEMRLRKDKTHAQPNHEAIQKISVKINNVINGQIVLNNKTGEIGFLPNNSSKMLNLHATASGITSYGIIGLLIEKQVITPGSFIVIDEPEVNLHPGWQVSFIEHLFELSKNGIYVVLATHSNDVMECVTNLMDEYIDTLGEEHFSINRFSENGKTIIEEDEDMFQRAAKIKLDLTTPLMNMMFGDNE